MKEDFLQFVWKYKLFLKPNVKTTDGEDLRIRQVGIHNFNAGPDFLDARLDIDGKQWAGDVEIHVNSSDWIAHEHQNDDAYKKVILHVVYNNDQTIYLTEPGDLPVLELKRYMNPKMFKRFEEIIAAKSDIPCGVDSSKIDPMTWKSWMDRLVVERLERKCETIEEIFIEKVCDWEETLYTVLAQNFGFKVNANSFRILFETISFQILRRHTDSLFQLEAILFGQAGMLHYDFDDKYGKELKNEYEFLKNKYSLIPMPKGMWKYLRMMPNSFPSIRISQFAALIYSTDGSFFSKILEAKKEKDVMELFKLQASPYWENHSKLDKPSKSSKKIVGSSSRRNIMINSIVPILFFYGMKMKEQKWIDKAIIWLSNCPEENNNVVRDWKRRGFEIDGAAHSQGCIELKNEYCAYKKCLTCVIGLKLIQ